MWFSIANCDNFVGRMQKNSKEIVRYGRWLWLIVNTRKSIH